MSITSTLSWLLRLTLQVATELKIQERVKQSKRSVRCTFYQKTAQKNANREKNNNNNKIQRKKLNRHNYNVYSVLLLLHNIIVTHMVSL